MNSKNDRGPFSVMIKSLPTDDTGTYRFVCVLNEILNSFVFEDHRTLLHTIHTRAAVMKRLRDPLVIAVKKRMDEQRAFRDMMYRKRQPISYERFRRAQSEPIATKGDRNRNQ